MTHFRDRAKKRPLVLVEALTALTLFSAAFTTTHRVYQGQCTQNRALAEKLDMHCAVNLIWYCALQPSSLQELGVTSEALEREMVIKRPLPLKYYPEGSPFFLKQVDLNFECKGQRRARRPWKRLVRARLTLRSELAQLTSEQWLIFIKSRES